MDVRSELDAAFVGVFEAYLEGTEEARGAWYC